LVLVDPLGRWGFARSTPTMSWAAMTNVMKNPVTGF
jgi:hypothetical protein